ncbi:hypothetical protein JCM24511_10181 [Saitozyma sp. JCM 24511]|nr:hypothetical protein JCM24511_10181 [Saitozyma sp. JCM 24511]
MIEGKVPQAIVLAAHYANSEYGPPKVAPTLYDLTQDVDSTFRTIPKREAAWSRVSRAAAT